MSDMFTQLMHDLKNKLNPVKPYVDMTPQLWERKSAMGLVDGSTGRRKLTSVTVGTPGTMLTNPIELNIPSAHVPTQPVTGAKYHGGSPIENKLPYNQLVLDRPIVSVVPPAPVGNDGFIGNNPVQAGTLNHLDVNSMVRDIWNMLGSAVKYIEFSYADLYRLLTTNHGSWLNIVHDVDVLYRLIITALITVGILQIAPLLQLVFSLARSIFDIIVFTYQTSVSSARELWNVLMNIYDDLVNWL